MFYYKVTIAYKGTAYSGWQAQALDDAHEKNPTVQGIVQKCDVPQIVVMRSHPDRYMLVC